MCLGAVGPAARLVPQGMPWSSLVCVASASAAANPSGGPFVSRGGRKWCMRGWLVYVSSCR